MISRCGSSNCPLCYVGRKGRSVHRGHFGWRPKKKRTYWSAFMPLKKPSALSGSPPQNGAALDAAFTKTYPTLHAYLADTTWEDGEERETATVTLFVEEGLFKICLNDRALGRSAWLSGHTFTGLLKGLEAGLLSDELQWRRRPEGGSGTGKRGRASR